MTKTMKPINDEVRERIAALGLKATRGAGGRGWLVSIGTNTRMFATHKEAIAFAEGYKATQDLIRPPVCSVLRQFSEIASLALPYVCHEEHKKPLTVAIIEVEAFLALYQQETTDG